MNLLLARPVPGSQPVPQLSSQSSSPRPCTPTASRCPPLHSGDMEGQKVYIIVQAHLGSRCPAIPAPLLSCLSRTALQRSPVGPASRSSRHRRVSPPACLPVWVLRARAAPVGLGDMCEAPPPASTRATQVGGGWASGSYAEPTSLLTVPSPAFLVASRYCHCLHGLHEHLYGQA